MAIQIRRTATPDNPPVGLVPGQLSVEMANDPPRLWVGVPTSIDPSGRVQVGGVAGPTSPPLTRGFVNKFRNPEFMVAQRGASGAVASNANTMTADGWRLLPTGATVNWQAITDPVPSTGPLYGSWLRLQSTSILTSLVLSQRIESFVFASLFARGGARPVTVQFTIFNDTTSAIVPTLRTVVPASRDGFPATQEDLPVRLLQSIAANQMRTVAYTYQPSALAKNGTEIQLGFSNVLGGNQNIYITHADIRATPDEALGLNDDPPEAEIPDPAAQWLFCQRYYQRCWVDQRGWGNVGQNTAQSWVIPVMRAAPSCSIVSVSHNTNTSVVAFDAMSANTLRSAITPSASGMMIYIYHGQADAEL